MEDIEKKGWRKSPPKYHQTEPGQDIRAQVADRNVVHNLEDAKSAISTTPAVDNFLIHQQNRNSNSSQHSSPGRVINLLHRSFPTTSNAENPYTTTVNNSNTSSKKMTNKRVKPTHSYNLRQWVNPSKYN